MRHVISAVVENKPGVLAHIAGLFAGRGFNIDSLAVGETEEPTRSRMTVVVRGDDAVLEQVRKQLGKIIDVIKVSDFSDAECVERDLMLLKVAVKPERRGEIFEIVEVFRGKVVDIGAKHLTLEISGPEKKVQAFIDLMKPYGIREVVRTGRIAMARGA
ncbi:MAG: acetolactate synthase small subunit [Planctomycetes bacterium]|nr:acetolactate synthase small subunit [Planctomycetota bacterium]